MASAAQDPFANAASKAPQTLGCASLKPKQTQVFSGVLDGLSSLYWQLVLCFAVLPAAFDYINPGGPPSTVLALLTHMAAMNRLANIARGRYF